MARDVPFPVEIRNQSVIVKIYRGQSKKTASGYVFTVAWVGAVGRDRKLFAAFEQAKEFAESKAEQLAKAIVELPNIERSDLVELAEARRIAGDVPVLTALREWADARRTAGDLPVLTVLAEWVKARQIAGPALVEACEVWAARRPADLVRIMVSDAVTKFIAAKEAAKKEGSRTYASKLKPIVEEFAGRYLDSITTPQWTSYLEKFEDGVTRNDMRKRAITLCRWAQRNGHLLSDQIPNIERTERAKEDPTDIGILTPETYAKLLEFFRREHPRLLGAVILAGLAGLRSDEIHGKRPNRDPRQSWASIRLKEKFLTVDAAKTNTPSHRVVHLMPNAVAWLRLCPNREGFVCGPAEMEEVRRLAIGHSFVLPDNCFRHSFITYRIALTGNKEETATEAGNSVAEIDRRYRVPMPRPLGRAWFAILPH